MGTVQTTACVRSNFFCELVVNVWNSLPDNVSFDSFYRFGRCIMCINLSSLLKYCRKWRWRWYFRLVCFQAKGCKRQPKTLVSFLFVLCYGTCITGECLSWLLDLVSSIFTNCASKGGNAIASNASICPFPLYLWNRLTTELEVLHMSRS